MNDISKKSFNMNNQKLPKIIAESGFISKYFTYDLMMYLEANENEIDDLQLIFEANEKYGLGLCNINSMEDIRVIASIIKELDMLNISSKNDEHMNLKKMEFITLCNKQMSLSEKFDLKKYENSVYKLAQETFPERMRKNFVHFWNGQTSRQKAAIIVAIAGASLSLIGAPILFASVGVGIAAAAVIAGIVLHIVPLIYRAKLDPKDNPLLRIVIDDELLYGVQLFEENTEEQGGDEVKWQAPYRISRDRGETFTISDEDLLGAYVYLKIKENMIGNNNLSPNAQKNLVILKGYINHLPVEEWVQRIGYDSDFDASYRFRVYNGTLISSIVKNHINRDKGKDNGLK